MGSFALPKSATGFRIAPESQLDLRPESDIVSELCSFRPVASEKNVGAFWNKGLDRMDWFPDCFVNRTMNGSHAGQHSADLVRLPLLFEHGGIWMDVGNMLHTHLDRLFWEPLTAADSPYEMGVWIISGQIRKQWGSFGNYMLAARKGCMFIKDWHNCYKGLWKDRTNADSFHKLPLVQDIGLAEGMADWNFQDKIRKMSGYVAHMLIADRTRNLLDTSTGWNGRDFFENKVFMVEFFTTLLDEPDTEKRQTTEDFVIEIPEKSQRYKVYRNSAGGLPALGDLVKKEGSRDADHRLGTFGEMYRYGTVHWESTCGVERLRPQPTGEELIRATPTEPGSFPAEL
ncbi:hypothetical protein DL769_011610 [Monosporascus sp. CRB-8-3]|nr:hypothetical protein DL769_011610 [Monosporascus sp. CRB-8-3]